MNPDGESVCVLVVEDEPKVASALKEGLEAEGYDVAIAPTGEAALARLKSDPFDIVLLDLLLPGQDGLQVLTIMRERGIETPVLVLTARDALEDRVAGLNTGADDYLVKPFAFVEVVARIRALLRRGGATGATRLAVGGLEMDLVTRRVSRAGRKIDLTLREFELLEYLLRYEHQVVSRDTLAREVWHEAARTASLDNVVDVHIARLRRKIDADHPIKLIQTVRGVGFMLREGEA